MVAEGRCGFDKMTQETLRVSSEGSGGCDRLRELATHC